ncbi:MAG: hypothetical protein ABIP48_17390 [Planctomycetota bacterium]
MWRSVLTTPCVIWAGLAVAMSHEAAAAAGDPVERPRLRAASLRFGVTPEAGGPTASRTGAVVGEVHGPLKTTVTLLEDDSTRLCLVATDFGAINSLNVSDFYRRAVAEKLGLPAACVLLFSSHNHSGMSLASNQVPAYFTEAGPPPEPELLPVGREFLSELGSCASRLPEMLEPVSVWWAEGREDRITHNAKGRRANGSTYFMREEDRVLLGEDFCGDIDQQAPIVLLKSTAGEPVGALVQFTGHPVTSYHPERPVVFGEWPMVACDIVGEHLSPGAPVAVGFLEGCAGDIASKMMFRGGVKMATRYGEMLGSSYVDALGKLRPSRRDGLDYAVEKVRVPLAPLPAEETLLDEIAEMEDFIRRASAGDENTLECVGMNFPRELTPAYRGKLVEGILPWSRWALDLHKTGRADTVAKHLEMEIYVIRLGDVGIVGMPCEPFQGIGRQIRARSPLPLTIPCGYTNVSHGYVTDAPNTGDPEYPSCFYRYTKFRPPLAKPAGDVLAEKAVEVLERFAGPQSPN